jgi:hypothetical protein
MTIKKIMRAKPRNGEVETVLEIGGAREEGMGYVVVGKDGEELGYFGADRYEDHCCPRFSRIDSSVMQTLNIAPL